MSVSLPPPGVCCSCVCVCQCVCEGGGGIFGPLRFFFSVSLPSQSVCDSLALSAPLSILPLPFFLGVPYPQPLPPPFHEPQRQNEESGLAKSLGVNFGLFLSPALGPPGPTDWEGVPSASLEGPESAPDRNLGNRKLLRNDGPQGFGPLTVLSAQGWRKEKRESWVFQRFPPKAFVSRRKRTRKWYCSRGWDPSASEE